MFDAEQVNKGKAIMIIMYIIPILFFLPLVAQDYNNPYGKFHANNCLLIFILGIIASILSVIIIGFLIYIFYVVLVIMGIISALNGTDTPLPLIGKINLINK